MIRAALALLLMTGSAFASDVWRLAPPPQYRNLPTGPIQLVALPSVEQSRAECWRRGETNAETACTFFYDAVPVTGHPEASRGSLCVIIYSVTLPERIKHEKFHCALARAKIPGQRNHEGWTRP